MLSMFLAHLAGREPDLIGTCGGVDAPYGLLPSSEPLLPSSSVWITSMFSNCIRQTERKKSGVNSPTSRTGAGQPRPCAIRIAPTIFSNR